MSRLKQVLREIHQRSLWQALVVYLGASFAVLEAADLLIERFGLPGWLFPVAFALLVVGLPVVIVASLAKEEVYGDEVPEEHLAAAAAEDRRLRLLTWRNAGLSFVAALALWGVVAAGLLLSGSYERASADERPSVAALPFEHRSGLEEDKYFTDGIHDEILTQLSKISGLSVRGRTSVMEYRDSPKNLRQIGEELNARYLLEGGVQRVGETVRITVQLVDSDTDEQIFADAYDRELSVENLLAVQRDIALRIADALQATLSAQERQQIEKVPTENLEAYDYYIRGNEYWGRGVSEEHLRIAIQMYERAVELDRDFALAYTKLSQAHARTFHHYYDRSEERLAQAKEAVDAAVRLRPDLPDAHLALGYYHYWGLREYERALAEFAIAERSQPNNSELVQGIAFIQRRLGNWEQALAYGETAVRLDPRVPDMAWQLGATHLVLRNYPEAERYFNRAIAVAPDVPDAYAPKAMLYVLWDGSANKARTVLEDASRHVSPAELVSFIALATLWDGRSLIRIDDAYREVLAPLSVRSFAADPASYFLSKAALHRGRSQPGAQRAHYDSARIVLETRVQARPQEGMFRSLLGLAYAGLDRPEEAIREAEKSVELLPVSRDAFAGSRLIMRLAEVYVMVERYEPAIDQLEVLLSIPSLMSVGMLRVDPLWDPLRDHPRFQALLERYEQ
jgi:TolB-like protein/Flp pilus assembly protein TadD